MRKNHQLVIVLILLFCAFALFLTACGSTKTASLESLQQNCIRIHIRANSNSQVDQTVKLKVRDAVTEYLTVLLADCTTKNQAYNMLDSNKSKIAEIAETTLKQHNFTYKTRIRLTNDYFPDRVYDEYEFPAGNYDALILELGSGTGDNWWCVAFPPLCFVPGGNNSEKIVYKSWIKEMLDKLFK